LRQRDFLLFPHEYRSLARGFSFIVLRIALFSGTLRKALILLRRRVRRSVGKSDMCEQGKYAIALGALFLRVPSPF